MTNLHVIRDTNLQDIPAMLRVVAGEIEAGNFGNVTAGALVLNAPQLPTFTWGQATAADGVLLFQAAIQKAGREILDGTDAL